MPAVDRIRRARRRAVIAVCALAMFLASGAYAQVEQMEENSPGETVENRLPALLSRIDIHQHLNQRLPLDLPFMDEAGKQVKLGDYFGKRPVILALVYYRCPILCSEELSGLVSSLEMVSLAPGKDFQIVVASIDPSEGPALARTEKTMYVKRYGRMDTAGGWHFLTGPESSIEALTQAVGFGYVRVPGPDGKLTQFAHSSAVEIATPDGRLAQYYMGVEYSPMDLKLGLIEASDHKIGTLADNVMTYCYHYDPKMGRHSMAIARIVQLACVITVLCLGSFMVVNFRRDIKEAAEFRAGSTRANKG